MARVLRPRDAEVLALRGRRARVLLNGEDTNGQMTVRVVEVEPERRDAPPRPLHVHEGVGEFIWILEGSGLLQCDAGVLPAEAGEVVYVPAGEMHKIMPRGAEPLHLLCVFPTGDIASHTKE
ncbi:MAG: cupin domain-containing protein [Acidobacteriota bacterium]|nr:cupin domain-containing protein [Acidobacteriota bacterium]